MTIDEVIALLKFNNKHIADLKNDDLQQIADWLEELKANRIALEKANGYLEANCRLGYIKGIDDFVKMAYEELLYSEGLTEIGIDYIAGQLKAGNNNGS